MKNIKIIIDSFASLSKSEVEKLGYAYIPLISIIDGKEYLDGIDISSKKAFALIQKSTNARTSQPSVQTLITTFDKYSKECDHVFYLAIGSGLSSTVSTATQVAKDYKGKITVIDNYLVGGAILDVAKEMEKMSEAGKSVEEIVKFVQDYNKKVFAYVIPQNLNSFKKSGRIAAASKFILNKLKFVPVLHYSDKVRSQGLRRTQKHSIVKATAIMMENVGEKNIDKYNFEVVHTGINEPLDYAKKIIKAASAKIQEIRESVASALIAVHTGVGAICITAYPKI